MSLGSPCSAPPSPVLLGHSSWSALLDHDSLSGSQSPDSDSSSSVLGSSYGSAANPILVDLPSQQFETSDWDVDSSSLSTSPPYSHEDSWSSDSWESPASVPPSNPWAHPSHRTIPGSASQQPGYYDPFFTGFADEVNDMWDLSYHAS
ncbi:hypothetical protein [Absidia glauca]|uniref:Uncharacterized protein n=1 Tax=Absidia glauca TaxID=4829 RepID=A0A168KXA8_ABSGL|nr:hypothetical protein [Absidia glauca]